MSKRQKTVAAFGFTKAIKHRNELVPVNIPTEVNNITCTVDCSNCKKRFKNNQGLGVHKLPCTKTKGHVPPQLTDVHDTGVSEKREDTLIDDVVKSTVNYSLSRVDCEESESGSSHVSRGIKRKPKGSEVRKSHPAVFKAKIIHQCQPGVSQY